MIDKDIFNKPMTAEKASKLLGKTYFYRQKIYRQHNWGRLPNWSKDRYLFKPIEIISAFELSLKQKLKEKLKKEFSFKFDYSLINKEVNVSLGLMNGKNFDFEADTETENEKHLLLKVLSVVNSQLQIVNK